MADHPLRPANDRRLGRPLPHQLANRTQAPPQATPKLPWTPLNLSYHAVLAVVSHSCPPPKDRYLRVTHPSATDRLPCPCDLHVLSMPPAFALSQDQTLRFNQLESASSQARRTRSRLSFWVPSAPSGTEYLTSVSVTHKREHIADTPIQSKNPDDRTKSQSSPINQAKPNLTQLALNHEDAANVSLPSLCNCQRTKAKHNQQLTPCEPAGQICFAEHQIRCRSEKVVQETNQSKRKRSSR